MGTDGEPDEVNRGRVPSLDKQRLMKLHII